LAVLAHEFEHLIHHNYDVNEEAWVDEGMAELAMWLYGNPDTIIQFNTNPDRQLTLFSGGSFADYVKTYLWSLYFFERYGGQPSVTALISKPQNGIAGFEAVLDQFAYSENFVDVFADWVVANYLDDVSIADGRYGYVGETLPPFTPFSTFSAYPVGPNSANVNHWAADYARYLNANAPHMTFDGSDNSLYRVRALLLDPSTPTEVVDMTLGAGQTGTLPLPQVGNTHDEVVMVYSGASSTGGLSYQYGAGTGVVGAPERIPSGFSLSVLGSVSAHPRFIFSIPQRGSAGVVRLEIFDVAGRLVRRLVDSPELIGRQEVAWNGRDEAGRLVSPGTFFARLTAGQDEAGARVTLVR
jgi:hypothetical protein